MASTPHKARQPRAARVSRACDYCREKRLKCTANQRPCMNCQLYNAKCQDTKKRTVRSRREPVAFADQPRVAASQFPSHSLTQPAQPSLEGDTEETRSGAILGHVVTENSRLTATPAFGNDVPNDILENISTTDDLNHNPASISLENESDFWNMDCSFDSVSMFESRLDFPLVFPPDRLLVGEVAAGELTSRQHSTRGFVIDDSNNQINIQATGISQQSSARGGKVSGIQSLSATKGPEANQCRILPGLFIRKDVINSNFIGLNSTGGVITSCIKECLDISPGLLKSNSFDYLIDAGRYLDESGMHSNFSCSTDELPSKQFAAMSIKSYFENVHIFYPIVNEDEFYRDWEMLYNDDGRARCSVDPSTLYIVVSIGSMDHPSSCGADLAKEKANRLYWKAWTLFHYALGSPTVETVQLLLLHCIFQLYSGRSGMAWILCGFAIRVAQAMGLHMQSPADLDMTDELIRLRSRIWWVAFSLDALLSMTQGRPPAVVDCCHDDQSTASEWEIPFVERTAQITSSLYFWRLQLAHIQNQLCHVLNRRETIMARLDALGELDRTLTSWRDTLPVECRPEQDFLVPHESYYPLICLHLEYFNLLRAIHWAAIASSSISHIKLDLNSNPRIRASEAICLTAARSFIQTLNSTADEYDRRRICLKGVVADHYMTALSVLCRNIFRYPKRLSTNIDLEYFRTGKIHLDRYLALGCLVTDDMLKELSGTLLSLMETRLINGSGQV